MVSNTAKFFNETYWIKAPTGTYNQRRRSVHSAPTCKIYCLLPSRIPICLSENIPVAWIPLLTNYFSYMTIRSVRGIQCLLLMHTHKIKLRTFHLFEWLNFMHLCLKFNVLDLQTSASTSWLHCVKVFLEGDMRFYWKHKVNYPILMDYVEIRLLKNI